MLSKVYFIIVFCLMLILSFEDFRNSRVSIKLLKLEKMPTNTDLFIYLDSLNRVIDFSMEHKNDIDINLYFGLFIVNVNLKTALRETHQVLPKKLNIYITQIIWKTEILLGFFKQKIGQNHSLRNEKYKSIFSLLANTTTWVNRLPKFSKTRLNMTTPYLEKVPIKWLSYKENVDDRNAWVPNPKQSDLCLASLALSKEKQLRNSRKCKVLKSCYEIIKKGVDFGYALAHRLLFLQQARFSKGCSVFSEQEDKKLRLRFCSVAYQEAEYIALHDFELVDLLLEHVCLCALDGYVQFLRPSWLTKALTFQTVQGCFSPYSQSSSWEIVKPDINCLNKYCNGHTTAVAAGTLALGCRLILQLYY